MIGIIGAMDNELEVFLSKMTEVDEVTFGIRTFYVGLYNTKEVVVVKAGISKVNAAITTTLLIENFDIDAIINIGVAGGINGVKHKDVVISTEVVHHDMDATKFSSYVHGQVPGLEPTFKADTTLLNWTKSILETLHFDYKVGRIASGDQFVTDSAILEGILNVYDDIYAVEMEAAAIAQTAHLYHVPFIVYRSISDVIGDDSQEHDFYKFVEEAALNASIVLEELLKVLS